MRLLLVVLVLSCSVGTALAGDDSPPAAGTSSVADMLQRRQENQLREQFVQAGRWDEVRRMDDEQLRRQQVQKKQRLTRFNAELAREGTVDSPLNGDGVFNSCAPVRVPAKVEAMKTRSDTASTGANTDGVR